MSANIMAEEKKQRDDLRGGLALAQAVLEKDLGEYRFEKCEIATTRQNDRVPGLGGLMFVHYKKPAGPRIMLSIQWFEKRKDLKLFLKATGILVNLWRQEPLFHPQTSEMKQEA